MKILILLFALNANASDVVRLNARPSQVFLRIETPAEGLIVNQITDINPAVSLFEFDGVTLPKSGLIVSAPGMIASISDIKEVLRIATPLKFDTGRNQDIMTFEYPQGKNVFIVRPLVAGARFSWAERAHIRQLFDEMRHLSIDQIMDNFSRYRSLGNWIIKP